MKEERGRNERRKRNINEKIIDGRTKRKIKEKCPANDKKG